jgi:hypothetical protein
LDIGSGVEQQSHQVTFAHRRRGRKGRDASFVGGVDVGAAFQQQRRRTRIAHSCHQGSDAFAYRYSDPRHNLI